VAIASAAGLVAATAAGLATSDKGRKLTRQIERKVSPMMRRHWHNVMNSVESALADYGVLKVIPAGVREAVVQRLCMSDSPTGNGASGTTSRGSARSRGRGGRRRTGATTMPM
jgi:hypothetical protein